MRNKMFLNTHSGNVLVTVTVLVLVENMTQREKKLL